MLTMNTKLFHGFSLVELLVVITLLSIIAGLGTVGYQSFIEGSRYKTTSINRDTVSKKITNDDMAVKSEMLESKTCYDYLVEDVITSEDSDIHDNAYNSNDTASWVNGHTTNEFDQGQHLIYCARPGEQFDPMNSAIMICSCSAKEGCIAGGSICPNPLSFP